MGVLFVVFAVLFACAVGGGIYFYLERQARRMRTRFVELPTGMRFECQAFSAEVHRNHRQLMVKAPAGQLATAPLPEGPSREHTGAIAVDLPAPGMAIQFQATGAAAYTLVFSATDEFAAPPGVADASVPAESGSRYVLQLHDIDSQVAAKFQIFAKRVTIWSDKLKKRIEAERRAQKRREMEAEKTRVAEEALAAAKAKIAPSGDLTEAQKQELAQVQIAQWRKLAGFTGSASDVRIDKDGRIEWFIDMNNEGGITLHADKRTIFTTLAGATIQSVGGELEIGVRDEYWSEAEPDLRLFRVLKGTKADERRAWKERLEVMRDSLRSSNVALR